MYRKVRMVSGMLIPYLVLCGRIIYTEIHADIMGAMQYHTAVWVLQQILAVAVGLLAAVYVCLIKESFSGHLRKYAVINLAILLCIYALPYITRLMLAVVHGYDVILLFLGIHFYFLTAKQR